MNLTGKKVLVTGADGFIGSHLAERLLSEAGSVRAMVLYNSFNSWGWLEHAPKDIEVMLGDVRDPFGTKKMMEGCDVVMHLAALIAIPYSYHSPQSYVETNVGGTLNVLQAARELGTERVIHTSTSEVYGTAQFVPITELHPLQGQSPYSATKIGADQMALAYFRSFDTPVSVLRPFNTYGPRQSARAIIPTIITQILAGAKTIELGSLEPTRDLNFVDDTTSAFIAMAKSDATLGQVVNTCTEFEISVGDLAKLIAEVMGVQIEIKTDQNRVRPKLSEVERLLGSRTQLQKLMPFRAEYSGLEGLTRGIQKTANWFQHPENLALYKAGIYNI